VPGSNKDRDAGCTTTPGQHALTTVHPIGFCQRTGYAGRGECEYILAGAKFRRRGARRC